MGTLTIITTCAMFAGTHIIAFSVGRLYELKTMSKELDELMAENKRRTMEVYEMLLSKKQATSNNSNNKM